MLNPSHTFDNFMVGGSNQFAYAAAKSVSEKPGEVYNPLFIYGGVGLGKTHLMQAAGNVLQNRGKNVIYTTVEQFLNDFLRHVRNQTMERFKEKYRKCDVLLIDDIQFLSNKDTIQEEFFHTFEALKGEKKQIISKLDKQIANLSKTYHGKAKTLESIYDKKVNYRLKSEIFYILAEDLAKFDVHVDAISTDENSVLLSLVSSDDRKFTELIKYISDKHFDELNSIDIELIEKDPESAYYKGLLKVDLR